MRKTTNVSQGDIAKAVGLSRAAVSQILTQNPVGRFRPETIKKVMTVARKMGYNFSRPTQRYRRRGERISCRSPVHLQIIARSGETFSVGQGTVKDISESGLLISDINLQPASLPAEPFTIRLSFMGGELQGLTASARPIRWAKGTTSLRIGAEFVGLRQTDKSKIQDLVKERTGC